MALRLFLAVVAVVLLLGAAQRCAPTTLAGALVELTDGEVDRDQRAACLQVVLEQGRASLREGDLRGGLLAAMAAVELGDEAAYREISAAVGSRTAFLPGAAAGASAEAAWLADASLGEAHLRGLLEGHLAENRADLAAARASFARSMRASRLAGAALAGRLAAEGLARLPE